MRKADAMTDRQLELFPLQEMEALDLPSKPQLQPSDTLVASLEPFTEYMQQKEFAQNTIEAFLSDMSLLVDFVGPKTSLGDCSTQRLRGFISYLRHGRGAPCSLKSLDRRITTLKVFFGWLADKAVLPRDPAAPLEHYGARSPLPQVLSDAEIERVLEITRNMRDADQEPDARPHLLISLILTTGIKKAECMGIALQHSDISEPERPSVYIRHTKPRKQFKSRRLALPADFVPTLEAYLRRYQPTAKLFECTPRNLEYVLHRISTVANLRIPMTFERLRWTSAVRSFREGMNVERLRRRLGLSRISWQDTFPIIQKLAEEPL